MNIFSSNPEVSAVSREKSASEDSLSLVLKSTNQLAVESIHVQAPSVMKTEFEVGQPLDLYWKKWLILLRKNGNVWLERISRAFLQKITNRILISLAKDYR